MVSIQFQRRRIKGPKFYRWWREDERAKLSWRLDPLKEKPLNNGGRRRRRGREKKEKWRKFPSSTLIFSRLALAKAKAEKIAIYSPLFFSSRGKFRVTKAMSCQQQQQTKEGNFCSCTNKQQQPHVEEVREKKERRKQKQDENARN